MAGSRAGLKKVVKTVRGKKGTVKRTYWMKASQAAKSTGGFLRRHGGKIAAGAALVGAGLLAARHRGAIKGAYHGAKIANAGASGVSKGMHAVTGHGLSLGQRAKAVIAGASSGAKIGGAHDSARRAVGAAQSAADRVRSIPAGIQGGASGVRLGGRLLKGAASMGARASGAVGRATSRAMSGAVRATPTLAKAGAAVGYHADRAKRAARRAFGRS